MIPVGRIRVYIQDAETGQTMDLSGLVKKYDLSVLSDIAYEYGNAAPVFIGNRGVELNLQIVGNGLTVSDVLSIPNEWRCDFCGLPNNKTATYCGELHAKSVGCGAVRPRFIFGDKI